MTRRILKDQRGIASIFLILFLVLVVGFVGFFSFKAYDANKKANQDKTELRTPAKDKAAQANPCKELVTKYEKLKVCYPEDVTFTDTSYFDPDGLTTGLDHLKFTKGNYALTIQAGLYGVGGACEECTVPLSEPITVLGKARHLNFVSNNGQTVGSLLVAKTPDAYLDFVDAKNVKTNEGGDTLIGITITLTNPETADAIKNNADFLVLKKIVTDLHY